MPVLSSRRNFTSVAKSLVYSAFSIPVLSAFIWVVLRCWLFDRKLDQREDSLTETPLSERQLGAVDIHVALLVGGAVRSLVAPIIHSSLRQNLIGGLQEISNASVHTMLELSVVDASSHSNQFGNNTDEGHVDARITTESLEAMRAAIRPSSYSMYEAKHYHFEAAHPFGRNCSTPHNGYWLAEAAIANFETSKKLYDASQKVANSAGIKFEWYIRTRPDIMWLKRFPVDLRLYDGSFHSLLYDASCCGYLQDSFYIVHRSVASSLWASGSSVLGGLPCEYTADGANPEAILRATTLWLGVRPAPIFLNGINTFATASSIVCPRGYTPFTKEELIACLSLDAEYKQQRQK